MTQIVDQEALPYRFPTHQHSGEFWEELGCAVATFGFLEEVLGKAIFVFTGTRQYSEKDVEAAFIAWLPQLEGALSNPLGNLIDTYAKAVRGHPDATIENLDDLVKALRRVSKLRNVLCHGSWRSPDKSGASVPFFVNTQMEVVDTAVDVPFLRQTQATTVQLSCAVIDTVTHMGWQFPGSGGGRAAGRLDYLRSIRCTFQCAN